MNIITFYASITAITLNTSDFPDQYQINDPLKKNDLLEDENLVKSDNVNHMDVIYHDKNEVRPRIDPFDGW